jgi:hypothetical protein
MGTVHHLHVVHPRGVPSSFAPPLALPLLPVVALEPLPVGGFTTLQSPPVSV